MLDKLIDLLVEFLGLFKCWHVVDPYEEGLVLRLGKLHRHIDCGFHWIIPLGVERVLDEHVVPAVHVLENECITTRDDRTVGFRAVVTYRVTDIEKVLLKVEDGNHAVVDACAGEIARVLKEMTWEEIRAPGLFDALTAAARKRGFRFGVEIMSVQLAGLALCRAIRLMGEIR
jgi:regulator of protease activity HflC (stomatin/prohibitin superfamily)